MWSHKLYSGILGAEESDQLSKFFERLAKKQDSTAQIQGTGGLTYTRWGRTTCPRTPGTQLVYAGRVGGTFYNELGGGANYLCMPNNPDYILPQRTTGIVNGFAFVHGGEYQHPIRGTHNYNVPCAVCYTSTRETVLMIPAKAYCPSGWTREYYGYLMTEYGGVHHTSGRTMFECVDRNPEAVPGSYRNEDGVLFYHVEASCNGLPCPPYDQTKELNCAVCTRWSSLNCMQCTNSINNNYVYMPCITMKLMFEQCWYENTKIGQHV